MTNRTISTFAHILAAVSANTAFADLGFTYDPGDTELISNQGPVDLKFNIYTRQIDDTNGLLKIFSMDDEIIEDIFIDEPGPNTDIDLFFLNISGASDTRTDIAELKKLIPTQV